MKPFVRLKILLEIWMLFLLISPSYAESAKKSNINESLEYITSIPLPKVNGRIDHMDINLKQQIVYIAALGNNTVEVVDLKQKKVIHTIKGLAEPQGVVYIPESNAIFVSNGETGICDVFRADSYAKIKSIRLDGDADNIRYIAAAQKIYVGYGDGGIAIIDARSFNKLADIKLAGHPESFQIDKQNIYVNVPTAHLIEVIDKNKQKVIAKWKIEIASANFPMALDTTNHILFIGCRHPSKLLVMNAKTGAIITSLDTDGDMDDIFFNPKTKQLYMSFGDGFVEILNQITNNQYQNASRISTAPGARTSLFVPELNLFMVAAPARLNNEARLMIYKIISPLSNHLTLK